MMHLPLSDVKLCLQEISKKIKYLNIIRKLYNILYTYGALLALLSSLLCPRDEESVRSSVPPFVRPFVRPDIDTWFVRLSSTTVLELQL